MYKQGFEEAEEPEIKLSSFIVQWRKQGSSRKTSTSVSLTTQKPLTVWIILWKILKELGTPDHLTCLLRNLYAGQEVTEPDMEKLVQNWERSTSRLYIVTLLI